MHFINPYTDIYIEVKDLQLKTTFPFYKEVIWTFLKYLNNQLGLFKHRVNINFVNSDQQTGTRKFGSIYEYRIKVDGSIFLTKQEEEKRDFLLDIVYEAYCGLAKEHGWNIEAIDNAYQKAKRDNKGFSFQSDYKLSRNKNYAGALLLVLDGNYLIIDCSILDKSSNSLFETRLLETDEDNFSWWRRIKEYGWYDNNRFGLKFLSGDYWIVYNIQNQQIEEINNPKKQSIKEVEKFIKEIKPLRTTKIKAH
ncbi:hypothetical protein AAE02nite_51470 [Adhaeribacter aerolatus]|uniref:Uncharacterized protein n=1 Tax=Adhaeribacter aerolatus TaxID=670289 RepID=A0A512B6A0_9BACT|nr:hypothetical protein [Adhaeribacter aerolatus]GEO07483.1 hypothetical protein AAE02nite_51470 [Adhaeribacter aerolatus]